MSLLFTDKFVPAKFVHNLYEFVHDQDQFHGNMYFFFEIVDKLVLDKSVRKNQGHSNKKKQLSRKYVREQILKLI